MTTEELFAELRRLNRGDKLRAMELLVLELASEEDALLTPGAHYEVWSPFDAASAADTLTSLLAADEGPGNGAHRSDRGAVAAGTPRVRLDAF